MAVTAQQVYEIALVHIDEVLETGAITADPQNYYKAKAIKLLTTLQADILPHTATIKPITDLAENLSVSDKVALTVLPYGLAAHFLIVDDPNTASFYNARYDELKRKAILSVPIQIEDVYGALGVNE